MSYYKEIYATGSQAWATVAVVDSKEVGGMTSVLKEEIVEHHEDITDFNTENIQEYGKSTAPDIAVDMRHFVKELNGGTVPSQFDAQLNKTVIYKDCMETARPSSYGVDVANYCGLGIYVPVSNRKKWNTYFKTIDWYTASGWNEVTFSWDLFPID